jgi:hypothetical protein
MKSKLLIVISTCFLYLNTSAQVFTKGTNVASISIGLGSSILSYSGASQSPAFNLQFERGIWPIGGPGTISLGGYVGIKSYKYSGKFSTYSYEEKWKYTIIGVRSAYHYNGLKNDKLDVYGGVMLSYNILSFSYSDNSPSGNYANSGSYGSAAGFTLYIGGRYFFTSNIAGQAELGYGVSYLSLGIALKI